LNFDPLSSFRLGWIFVSILGCTAAAAAADLADRGRQQMQTENLCGTLILCVVQPEFCFTCKHLGNLLL